MVFMLSIQEVVDYEKKFIACKYLHPEQDIRVARCISRENAAHFSYDVPNYPLTEQRDLATIY